MVNARKTEDRGRCDGGGDLIILAPQWPGVVKAGHRPALRSRANGNNGAPVCHRFKPCLSAASIRSVKGECTRRPSRHTQSRSLTGVPFRAPQDGVGPACFVRSRWFEAIESNTFSVEKQSWGCASFQGRTAGRPDPGKRIPPSTKPTYRKGCLQP